MALVSYSDSEASSDEQSKPSQKSNAKQSTNCKPAFQKLTDRANPHRIRVNLPEDSKPTENEQVGNEPPAKRAKTSSGLGGFNAMLPAPKRPRATVAQGGLGRGKGLGSGVSLKTGAAPGFSRELLPSEPELFEQKDDTKAESTSESTTTVMLGPEKPADIPEPKNVGSAMMFKPLSVARKPQKKKASAAATALPTPTSATTDSASLPKAKPKVSLFSTPALDDDHNPTSSKPTSGAYEPLIHTTTPAQTPIDEESNPAPTNPTEDPAPPPSAPSLNSLASTLNLSASDRRRIFGRHGALPENAKVVEFNTDAEYAANEELRAKGEVAPAANPVRGIGGGKHSLQSLMNMVADQRDALEESFAAGRRNKKEAGSRYGW